MGEKIRPKAPRVQYGALPYRFRPDGSIEILLVTTRRTRRWIIPKGWKIKGKKPARSAAQEAFEEAGIIGDMWPSPVTTYRYMKALDDGSEIPCRVAVFGMNVRGTLTHWREKDQRQRRWFSVEAAADRLDDIELSAFVRALATAPERLEPSDRPASRHLARAGPSKIRS